MSEHEDTNSVNSGETSAEEPMGAPVVAPLVEKSKLPWGPIVGGIAVAGVLIGGVWFASSGESEVDLASTDPVEAVAEDSGTEEESIGEETSDESDDVADADGEEAMDTEFAEEAMMEDAAMVGSYGGHYGGASQSVWVDGQFVRLENSPSGWTTLTSTDGLEWAESPATGLPAEGYLYNLVEEDGLIVGMVEFYDENGASHYIASSTDGSQWSTVELPGSGENSDAGYNGIAILDGNVVTIRTIYDNGNDPYFILMEAGILDGMEEEFCGFDYADEGSPIQLFTCSYDEYEESYPSDEEIDALAARYDAAETDEERRAIEQELDKLWGGDQEVLMTINPGDPLYAELQESFFGDFESEMTVEVISGPVAGPFEVSSPFTQSGYPTGLVQTDSAIFTGFEMYDDERGTSEIVILTSVDGQSWSEVSAPAGTYGGGLQGFGNVLFFMSYDDLGGSTSYISTDGAQTWTESPLESELYETYSQFMAGEAGIVAMTQGAVEPYEYNEEPFAPGENPVLEKDGFSLELGWNGGSMTLSGPDGVIIELSEEEAWTGQSDVVRTNPINGNMTFIDEATGEDLVTFTEDDWAAAYGGFEEEYYGEEVYEEPEMAVELAFSLDGVTWSSLDASQFNDLGFNSYAGIVGVGDDEAVFFIETYNDSDFPEEIFAFEEEGREPTEAEIEAIELWEGNQSSIEYVRVPLG